MALLVWAGRSVQELQSLLALVVSFGFRPAEEAQGVFDVGGFQEFEAARIYKGMLRREVDFEGVAVVGGSEEKRRFYSVMPDSRWWRFW